MRRRIRSGLIFGALYSLALGCNQSDATGVPASQNSNPYVFVQLNVRAAVLSTVAPYDTLQLIPTAYDANGNILPFPGLVSYGVNDTTLKVSASGLLQITSKPGTNAMVIVSVQDTLQNITHSDTAFIAGTTTVPSASLVHFSIQPTGTDSAVLDINNGTKTLSVAALDANGKVIPTASLKIHFTSTNQSVAKINATTGVITAQHTSGTVLLTASTTYYGVTKTDSVDFRIGYPDTTSEWTVATVLPDGSYRYNWVVSNLVTGIGKTVIFTVPVARLGSGQKLLYAGSNLPLGDRTVNEGVSVVFDAASAAQASPLVASLLAAQHASNGTGNITLQIPDSVVIVDTTVTAGNGTITEYSKKLTTFCSTTPYPCATARSFSTPGTYHFTSPTTGASGTITVVAP